MFGVDGGDLLREIAEPPGVVVEAGDDERDDLHPKLLLLGVRDRFEDGLEAAAERLVLLLAEAFEVDAVDVGDGGDEIEGLSRGVTVGDDDGDEAARFRLREDVPHPLRRDHRFVVGCTYRAAAFRDRFVDQGLRGDRDRDFVLGAVTKRLRNAGIVAVGAAQIAAVEAEGERLFAREHVVDGVRFDRSYVLPRDPAVGRVEHSALAVTNATRADAIIGERAPMRARGAAEDAFFVGEELRGAHAGLLEEIACELALGAPQETFGREDLVAHGRRAFGVRRSAAGPERDEKKRPNAIRRVIAPGRIHA